MSTTTNQNETKRAGGNYPQPVRGDANYQPSEDIIQYLKDYSRARPDVVAMWCFGVGFVLGWKLKPW